MQRGAVRIFDEQDHLVLVRLAEDEFKRVVEALIIPAIGDPARMARAERRRRG